MSRSLKGLLAGLAAVSIGVMSAQATEPDYGDAATCYPLYFAAQDNIDSLLLLAAEDWDHLGEAQFDQRHPCSQLHQTARSIKN